MSDPVAYCVGAYRIVREGASGWAVYVTAQPELAPLRFERLADAIALCQGTRAAPRARRPPNRFD